MNKFEEIFHRKTDKCFGIVCSVKLFRNGMYSEIVGYCTDSTGIYLFKVNNGKTEQCEICLKIKTRKPHQRRRSGALI